MGAVQAVDADEEAGQGLAGARRRRDQRVEPRRDVDPALGLGPGGTVREAAPEPLRDRRMEDAVGLGGDPRDPQGHLAGSREGSHGTILARPWDSYAGGPATTAAAG